MRFTRMVRRWQRSILLVKGGHRVGDYDLPWQAEYIFWFSSFVLLNFLPKINRFGLLLRHKQILRETAKNDNSARDSAVITIPNLFATSFLLFKGGHCVEDWTIPNRGYPPFAVQFQGSSSENSHSLQMHIHVFDTNLSLPISYSERLQITTTYQ